MKRDEIAMGAAARDMLLRELEIPEPLGRLSAAEASLGPVGPASPSDTAWVEREELFAYAALDLAARYRRIATGPGLRDADYFDTKVRLEDARATARLHLSNLQRAGKLTDALLLSMAQAEGITP
jgi:hypothetical protein